MSLPHWQIDVPPLPVPRRAVLRRLGYPPDVQPEGAVGRIWEAMLEEASRIIAAKAVLRVVTVARNDGQAVCFLNTDFRINSMQVARLLTGSKHAVLMVCTIGSALENRSRRYTDAGQVTEGVILDAIGSETADAVADWVHHHAWQEMEMSVHDDAVTPRFSPGYGDWSLEAQLGLIAAVQADHIGITLNESLLMHPRKSVSAIFAFKNRSGHDRSH